MARVRSVDFLPEIFQTDANKQFLAATLDQLVQEPKFKKTQGFIGRSIGPGVNPDDKYVVEPTKVRQDYQLEPGVISLNPADTSQIQDAITYPGVLDALSYQGADVNRPDRLFRSDYYTWDPFVDFDAFINYSQYYWVPNGPDVVNVYANTAPLEANYIVTRANSQYTFGDLPGANPTLTLVRGGNYTFQVANNNKETITLRVTNNGTASYSINYEANPTLTLVRGNTYVFTLNFVVEYPFWIKTQPTTGIGDAYNNGVTNNGASVGTVVFTVPLDAPDTLYYAAQNNANMQGQFTVVDAANATGPGFWIQTAPSLSGANPSSPNISTRTVLGVSNNGTNLGTVTFNVPQKNAQQFYYDLTVLGTVDLLTTMSFDQINGADLNTFITTYGGIDGIANMDALTLAFVNGDAVAEQSFWTISYLDVGGTFYIQLTEATAIPTLNKFTVLYGTQYANTQWYKNESSAITAIPLLSAVQDVLYYQDGANPNIFGQIKLVEQTNTSALDITEIIGKKNYTSPATQQYPTGVEFTNGLKVKFTGDVVPQSYWSGSITVSCTQTTESVNAITCNSTQGLVKNQSMVFVGSTGIGGIVLGQTYYVNRIITNTQFTISDTPDGPAVTLTSAYLPPGQVLTATATADKQYYVSGVGTAIKLLPVEDFVVPETYATDANTETVYIEPSALDYITIDRASPDLNAWSRSNRWFHVDVLTATATYNATRLDLINSNRARRPILQFRSGIRLFNMGTAGKAPVNVIDFTEIDALSNVEGLTSYTVNGYTLVNGSRIIFAADSDPDVRNKIYVVNFIVPDGMPDTPADELRFGIRYQISALGDTDWNAVADTTGVTYAVGDVVRVVNTGTGTGTAVFVEPVINLISPDDGEVMVDNCTVVISGTQAGTTYWYNGTAWTAAQQKTAIQQPPLYDVFDANGHSFSNTDVYPSTNFAGSKLFSYAVGVGVVDPVLQFQLQYRTLENIGDIVFRNDLYADTFIYVVNSVSQTGYVSQGCPREYADRTVYTRLLGWQTAVTPTVIRQQFKFTYNRLPLLLDVAALTDQETTVPAIKVFVSGVFLNSSTYSVSRTATTTTISLNGDYAIGTIVEIEVLSNQTSATGFYQVPTNLSQNPLNSNSDGFTLGTIRTHYETICQNLTELAGPINGANNTRDLGNIVPYGQLILQQSAPLTVAGYFMRSTQYNIFGALEYNGREYQKFKSKLLEATTTQNIDYNIPTRQLLDTVIADVITGRTSSNPFYWSDMIPASEVYQTTTHTFGYTSTATFSTLYIYNYTSANYQGMNVYVNDQIQTRGIDYVVNVDSASITFTADRYADLTVGDVIVIQEYQETYGTFVPNTPTKLGLYPAWEPQRAVVKTTRGYAEVIIGHDGSQTPVFNDIRDEVLLEFETRIYNNLKLDGNPVPLPVTDVLPGQFRETGFSYEEVNNILGESFLNYVGWNKLDYTSQNYIADNEFSFNYSQSTNTLNGEPLLGAWRGIYRWFYDTQQPELTPWEMLGFTIKPAWWEAEYGPAPYTADNLVLWDDLEAGLVRDPAGAYIKPAYVRPGLTKVIPVDSEGQLLPPLASVVGSYSANTFQKSWAVGDGGPVEASWWNSSDYPFAVMRLLALTRSAEFFTLFADRDLYRYSAEFDQYLYDNRYRLTTRINANQPEQTNIQVYGNGVSKASYIDWIVDYNRVLGKNSTTDLQDDLANIDVRLCYRMASFSDKQYIKIYTEKSSPVSTNTALLIPDESYDLLLYKNQPFDRTTYSSVVIQVVANGWAVFGYSQSNPYFETLTSIPAGQYQTFTVGTTSIQVPTFFTNEVTKVPYGYVFSTAAGVANFLLGYGKKLEQDGFTFTDPDNGYILSWGQMVQEFLYWSNQGWGQGTLLNLNPLAYKLSVTKPQAVVDSIAAQTAEHVVLDQNKRELPIRNLNIVRNENTFVVQPLTDQVMSFIDLRYTSYESMIVLDNASLFGDLIYEPITGARQSRLKIVAATTTEWNGSVDAQGFVINQGAIEEWSGLKTYAKGELVKYKNQYWSAATIVQPSVAFNYNDWNQSDYTMIERGLLPNLANKADQLANSYNINSANLESDNDLLSYGLIGFRPRQYLSALNLDDVSQLNVYRQFIGSKGTILSADLLIQSKLDKETANYTIYENWAVQRSIYGANANRNFIDLRLNRALLTSDPVLVQLINPGQTSQADQTILTQNVWKASFPVTSPAVFPTTTTTVTDIGLPTAGYVNLDDVDITVFELSDPASLRASIDQIQNGTRIWVAKVNDYDWNVYRAQGVEGSIQHVCDNLNGTSRVIFNSVHGLSVGDILIIKFFDVEVNGVYRVLGVPDINTVNIAFTFTGDRTVADGNGIGFTLRTMRVAQASDVASLSYANELLPDALVWVDNNGSDQWEVLQKQNPFVSRSIFDPVTERRGLQYGASVAQAAQQTSLFVGAPGYTESSVPVGAVYAYFKGLTGTYVPLSGIVDSDELITLRASGVRGFGNAVDFGYQDWAVIGASASFGPLDDPNSGYCAVVRLDRAAIQQGSLNPYVVWQLLTLPGITPVSVPGAGEFGYSAAMSSDERWLYVGAPGVNQVYAYARNEWNEQTYTVTTTAPTSLINIGNDIQIDNGRQIQVTANGVLMVYGTDYTVGNNYTEITFTTPIPDGYVIAVERNSMLELSGGSATYNIGQYLYGLSNIQAFTLLVDTEIQRPNIDYTFNVSTGVLTFTSIPSGSATIAVQAKTYFELVGALPRTGPFNSTDRFGHSVQCSTDGRKVVVGCRNITVDGQDQAGAVYVFDRNVQKFIATTTGTGQVFTVLGTVTDPVSVLLNGSFLTNVVDSVSGSPNTFSVSGNSVTINTEVAVGDVVEIETNEFKQIQVVTQDTVAEYSNFGQSLDLCPYNCSLYVGAPQSSIDGWKSGVVQRNVAQARTYGTITATVANPSLTAGQTLRVNNVDVAVPAVPNNTVAGLAAAINAHLSGSGVDIPNASAVVGTDGRLTIYATNPDIVPVGFKLEVAPGSGTSTVYQDLGFEEFVFTQTIQNPLPSDFAAFGSSVAISDTALTLVVGAPTASLYLLNTFDYNATLERPTTTFDGKNTTFYSPVPQSGAVYTFDYFPSAVPSVATPGKFVFGQQVANNGIEPLDNFGTAVNYTAGVLVAGAPTHDPIRTAGSFVSGTTYTILTLGTTDFTAIGAYINQVGVTFTATGAGTGTGTAFENGFNQGAIVAYENPTRTPAWAVLRQQQPVVDIYLLNSVFMYDRLTSERTEFFDYIDPIQGKILGAAQQNLNYIGAVDPAEYNVGSLNNTGNVWGTPNVGEMWWDTSMARFLDPNQDDIVYASRRWAQLFPGSSVDVYQWIESDQPPTSYIGTGTPKSYDSYVIATQLTAEGVFVTRYYYWVKNVSVVFTQQGKSLSAMTVAQYIESPKASGISYVAPINASTIAIYNGLQYINAADTIISVEFDRELNESNVHTEYELIAQDKASAFLSDALYRKLLDSFCGFDTFGNKVPDVNLPVSQQYGVLVRPRQSMFVNRYLALKNYIVRANDILAQYPIAETRNYALLYSQEPIPTATSGVWNKQVANLEILAYQDIYAVPLGYRYLVDTDSSNAGLWTVYSVVLVQGSATQRTLQLYRVQNYKTDNYWSFVNWYKPGYNASTKIGYEVPNYASLNLISAPVGTSVKVTANAQGKFEIYLLTDAGWERVGLQDGTIEISAKIYDYELGRFGFDSEVFDAQYFDQEPVTETRKILQSINEELFIDDLAIQRNKSLVLMFDYILSEQAAPEWLVKTSLIDVSHNIRELVQFPNYQVDNQTFVIDYLQEVKPYHVQVREFNINYNAIDEYFGSMTDFDLPAYYNTSLPSPQYVSPILLPYAHATNQLFNTNSDTPLSSTIWATWPYSEWISHYLLTLDSVKVLDGGSGYTEPPAVTIVGSAEVIATAEAVIDAQGHVVAINVLTPGVGYRETPTIMLQSAAGSGARAYPVMVNRSVDDFGAYVYNVYPPVSVPEWEFETSSDLAVTTVRSFKTTIKFDRFQYGTNISDWSAAGIYTIGNRVRYADAVWVAMVDNGPATEFSLAQWSQVPAGDLTGVDRTMGYYVPGINMPGLELPLLIEGVDYPGVQVYGHDFVYTDPLDTIYQSFWGPGTTLTPTGTGPTDVDVQGGNFVGYYEGHAPEELVNGAEFDTVDIRVFARPGADWEGDGHGFQVGVKRYITDASVIPSTWSWKDVVQYPVSLSVSNVNSGMVLTEGVDYTVDWANQTIEILSDVSAGQEIDIDVYEIGGGSQLYRDVIAGDELPTTMVIPVGSQGINSIVFFVNGVPTVATQWRPFYEPATAWNYSSTYAYNDVVYDTHGVYYRAIQAVPAGITLNNFAYWQTGGHPIAGQLQFTGAMRNTLVTVPVTATSNDLVVMLVLGNTVYPQRSWSTPQTQTVIVDSSVAASGTIQLDNYTGGTNSVNAIVNKNGFRLVAPAGVEWTGDGSTRLFDLPSRMGAGFNQGSINAITDVQVWVDGVYQIQGVDYSVTSWSGSNVPPRMVDFLFAPDLGSNILVTLATDADYSITNGTLQLKDLPSVGDAIAVTTFNDTSQQRLVTSVFVGPDTSVSPAKNNFNLNRVGISGTRLWVTLDGQRLFNGVDYLVQGSYLELATGTIGADQVMIITEMSESVVPDPMAFRIFQDMRGVQATYRITEASTAVLTAAVSTTDDVIYVDDAAKLPEPDVSLTSNLAGVVTINGERIMYRNRDINNNTISGLWRGTAGTAPAAHSIGDPVYSMSRSNIMPDIFQNYVDQRTIMADGVQTVFADDTLGLPTHEGFGTEVVEVYVGGTRQTTGFTTTFVEFGAQVVFDVAPAAGQQVTLLVRHGVTWYQRGVDTPSNGVALQQTNTAAARFLRGL